MAYLALYREWRPKTFAQIVGQNHITKTLTNALRQERVAHAYLFSGPRGTGKTTAAKILAKALNCEQPDGVEPCNQCASCQGIDHGNAMDVLEIDAASNRGIDEIRGLREKVNLSAGQSRYKVYIIDEVHMLTTEAFNALLKTLEEPPNFVVFILATTEVHKIPLTILSRVQRFEFHRIAVQDIQMRLAEVCQAMGREVEPAALTVIAQKSEGGLRDALSILDQCLISEDYLNVTLVYQILGMVGESYSAELVDALLAQDYAGVLSILAQGVSWGRDPRQIVRELLDYLRQLMLALATGKPAQVAPNLQEEVARQATQAGMERLLHWLGTLLQGESQLKYASNARLAVEMLLVQTLYESCRPTDSSPGEYEGKAAAAPQRNVEKSGLQGMNHREKPVIPVTRKGAVPKGAGINLQEQRTEPAGQEIPEGSPQTVSAALSLTKIKAHWEEVLERVRKSKKSTHAFLLEGRPEAVDGQTVILVFKEGFSFHRDKVEQPENRQTVEQALQAIFAQPLSVSGLMQNEFEAKCKNTSEQDSPGPVRSTEILSGGETAVCLEELVVKRAEDIFGRELVVVKEEGLGE